jgi:hypothetical protein
MSFKEKLEDLREEEVVKTSELMADWKLTTSLNREEREQLLSHIALKSESIPDRLRAIDLLCKMNKDFTSEKEDQLTINLVVSETDLKL